MTGKFAKDREKIGERLRAAREAAGLTQGQIAKKLGIHRPSISEIEAGRRRVSAEELAEMASAYGIQVGWITGNEAETSPENDKIVLAARQLSKLKQQDLDRLMKLIQMLRGTGKMG
ncbi:MAG: helix-turn-helix transcriptional regulator [Candidatus Binatia bacterium]